jgi:spermidine synthase
MYHVVATGLTAIALYLLSYFFYRSKFYSLQLHRKLWNFILAGVFIITAFAGLFMALQINYKWNIPVTKAILRWHVEFGIGTAFAGFFHFLWHFSYFWKISKKQETDSPSSRHDITFGKADAVTNLFIVGLISSSVQLLLLKEIMNITGGYELIAGIFLCSWLTASALGSRIAPKSLLSDIKKINIFFSTGPIISVILMLLLSRLYMKPGETPTFLASAVFTFLALVPFCFISGFTFIKLLSAAQKSGNFIPGKSFSIETAGGIAAGIIISLLSSGILNTYQTLLLIIILGFSYTILSFYIKGTGSKYFFKIGVLLVASFIIVFSPDILFRQFLLRGIKVTETEDTPYGNITLGKYQNEISTYYNQRLLAFSNDAVESEEDIHYALLQRNKPEEVLLISGLTGSRLREIEKYSVRKVVFVERDPALTKVETPVVVSASAGLVIENDDAFSYVRKTDEKFDAVILLLPPPSSLLLNRFYSLDFFLAAKKIMKPGGIFSCSPGINPNYFNKEAVLLYSTVFNSMKAVFNNVIPVSGNKLYFIASDKELSASICQLVHERNIQNTYVGPDYLSDDLITAKTNEVLALIDRNVKINRSALPIASFYFQSYNLSKNINEKIPAIILLIILFLLSLTSIRGDNGIMYFGASALAGYEIIILLILQLTAGNMYQITGLIIAGLMAGLALGSGMNIRILEKSSSGLKAVLLMVFYMIMGFASETILALNGRIAIVLILILSSFVPAIITGNIFRELTLGQTSGSDTSVVYSSDLAGSAMGFIIFSGIAVPLLGIRSSLFLLPVLILTGFIIWSVSNKRRN